MIKDLINPTNFNIMVSKLGNVLVKALDEPLGYAINWGRIWSLWPVHLETACCSVEFGAASGPRYDVERFGIIEAFGSLRQCDLIVVQGTVNRKMAPRLRMVYDQMPEPKYVIAMGACAITGGLYVDSYNVLPGVDGIIPVDVYVPGCPPRPETLIQGTILLARKDQKVEDQITMGQDPKNKPADSAISEPPSPSAKPTAPAIKKEPEPPAFEKGLISEIVSQFGEDKIKVAYIRPLRMKINVDPAMIIEVATFIRNNLGFDHVESVAGTDYPKDNQIEVIYSLGSYSRDDIAAHILALTTRTYRDDARLPTLINIYKSVEYHERETFEMLGVYFEGHPRNDRLLLPEDWADIPPLRKEFRIKGR